MYYLESRGDIETYIKRSHLTQHAKEYYEIHVIELNVLRELYERDPYHALCLAFELGKAKGYRAAKIGK